MRKTTKDAADGDPAEMNADAKHIAHYTTAKNTNLTKARSTKNDEFYTQYADIQEEINAYTEYDPDVFRNKTILLPCDDPEWSNFTRFFAQNFENFGLKKLISTSYAIESKHIKEWEETFFERENPNYNAEKSRTNGKIFVLERDVDRNGKINIDDLEWNYLSGDGDFRSDEVKALRDEADIIITNPPFSLFREFLAWIVEGGRKFAIIGNMNAITYKEVFPLIKENRLWLGATGNGSDMVFGVPKGTEIKEQDRQKAARLGYIGDYTRLGNSCWFTNIEYGRRHLPLELMSMADNRKFSRHKEVREYGYRPYDNYNAIEVPFTDAIPSDYNGAIGVPISFLDKYCPEQFEILGITKTWFGGATKIYPPQIQVDKEGRESEVTKLNDGATLELEEEPVGKTYYKVNSKFYEQMYARILIRKRQEGRHED